MPPRPGSLRTSCHGSRDRGNGASGGSRCGHRPAGRASATSTGTAVPTTRALHRPHQQDHAQRPLRRASERLRCPAWPFTSPSRPEESQLHTPSVAQRQVRPAHTHDPNAQAPRRRQLSTAEPANPPQAAHPGIRIRSGDLAPQLRTHVYRKHTLVSSRTTPSVVAFYLRPARRSRSRLGELAHACPQLPRQPTQSRAEHPRSPVEVCRGCAASSIRKCSPSPVGELAGALHGLERLRGSGAEHLPDQDRR